MSVVATIKSGDTIWGLVKAKNPGASDAEIQKKTQAVLDANGLTWESARKMHAGDTVNLDAAIDKPAAAPAPAPTPANTAQGAEGGNDFAALLQQLLKFQEQNQNQNNNNNNLFSLGGPGQNLGFNDPLGILGGFGGNQEILRAASLANIDPFAARNLVIGLLG